MARVARRCAAACTNVLQETARARTRYCSPACRQREYRSRAQFQLVEWLRQWEDARCDFCNQAIPELRFSRRSLRKVKVRSDTSYCSARCRQRSYRMRLGAKKLRTDLGISIQRR